MFSAAKHNRISAEKLLLTSYMVIYKPAREFVFLRGDCTLANTMVRNDTDPVLIDPHGYFGKTEFYFDAVYD